jgi:hypothetical protein
VRLVKDQSATRPDTDFANPIRIVRTAALSDAPKFNTTQAEQETAELRAIVSYATATVLHSAHSCTPALATMMASSDAVEAAAYASKYRKYERDYLRRINHLYFSSTGPDHGIYHHSPPPPIKFFHHFFSRIFLECLPVLEMATWVSVYCRPIECGNEILVLKTSLQNMVVE